MNQDKAKICKERPLTDRLWMQPCEENMIFDDENGEVIISIKDYDMLKDYTNSQPSCIYEGKMWKRKMGRLGNKKWYLCYAHDPNDKTGKIEISYYKIVLDNEQ